jgi:DNA polymerase-3 subunit delta
LLNKPNAATGKIFAQFIQNLSQDNLLIISCDKLDSATQKTSWFQAINDQGAIINIWPLDAGAFQQWVKLRLQQNDLSTDPRIVQFLVEQTEGNPLACAQEIEKLKLIYPSGKIPQEELDQVITDNARYDIFGFVDMTLTGNAARIVNALQKLRAEGLEAPIVLWALTREIRNLLNILQDLKNKISWESVTKKYRIWDKRSALVKNVLQKQSLENLHRLLLHAEKIDKMIKGVLKGGLWDELLMLALQVNGNHPFAKIGLNNCLGE